MVVQPRWYGRKWCSARMNWFGRQLRQWRAWCAPVTCAPLRSRTRQHPVRLPLSLPHKRLHMPSQVVDKLCSVAGPTYAEVLAVPRSQLPCRHAQRAVPAVTDKHRAVRGTCESINGMQYGAGASNNRLTGSCPRGNGAPVQVTLRCSMYACEPDLQHGDGGCVFCPCNTHQS